MLKLNLSFHLHCTTSFLKKLLRNGAVYEGKFSVGGFWLVLVFSSSTTVQFLNAKETSEELEKFCTNETSIMRISHHATENF